MNKMMIEALERRALLSGELDTSFGTGGVVTTNFDAFSEQYSRVTTDSSGRIYAAGFLGGKYLVARYTAAGVLDTSFNTTGYAQVPLTSTTGYPAGGLAVSPTGNVYVGGSLQLPGTAVTQACIVSLTPAGQLNTSFDGDGVWTGSWEGLSNNSIVGLAYAGGHLIAGGSDGNTFGVWGFNENGTLDPAFGSGNGQALYYGNGATMTAADMVVTPPTPVSGPPSIVLGGSRNGQAFVVGLNLNGTFDISFVPTSVTPSSVTPFFVTRLATDSLGRVYVGGAWAQKATVARLNRDGSLDTSFATGGFYSTTTTGQYTIASLTVTGRRQVLFTAPGTSAGSRVAVADELTEQGLPNQSFGNAGSLILPTTSVGYAATDANGKILLVGQQSLGGDQVDTTLLRLNTPPAATVQISGYLFDDVNGDGLQNDKFVSLTFDGISAYLDTNSNGAYDYGKEPTAYAGTGKFVFDNVPTGPYRVGLIIPPEALAVQTFPAGGFLTGTAVVGSNAVGALGVMFKIQYGVNGTIFNDLNGNGRMDTGEPGLSGRSILFDKNRNGVRDDGEPFVTSGADGEFHASVNGGTYAVIQQAYSGYHITGQYQFSPTPGSTFNATGLLTVPTDTLNNYFLFGQKVNAVLRTTVFNDANANGKQDTGDGVVSTGGFIYADLNNNSVYDAGDIHDVATNLGYSAMELPPGTYTLRQSLDTGWEATTPAQTVVSTPTSGLLALTVGRRQTPVTPATATITGRIFYDANRDGLFNEGDYGLDGDLFIDANNDGLLTNADPVHTSTARAGGVYSLQVPVTGAAVRLMFSNGSGYTATTPTVINLTPTAGATYANQNFGVGPIPTASTLSLSGIVYTDTNKNYKQDAGEPGMNLVRVYVDANNNSVVDDNEYATYTNVNGAFAFPAIPATGKNATVRVVLPAGYTLKYPSSNGGYIVPLTAKSNVTTLNFGLVPGTVTPPTVTPTTVTGLVYGDANKSNTKDGSETGLSGVTVFADANGNGLLDATEAKTTTTSTGAYTLSIPALGGATFTATVRVVLPSGYTQQTPTTNYAISVLAGATYTAKDFGLYKPVVTPPTNTASISGFAFNDTNKNGLYDSGDSLASGKTVWLDLDDDGVKDANEASATTDSAGKFTFKNLAAGKYHVRRVFPTGYLESTPARYITLTSGQAATDVRIGSKTK